MKRQNIDRTQKNHCKLKIEMTDSYILELYETNLGDENTFFHIALLCRNHFGGIFDFPKI